MPNLYLVLELNEKLVMKTCTITSIEEDNSYLHNIFDLSIPLLMARKLRFTYTYHT